jgi:hypothetical protein
MNRAARIGDGWFPYLPAAHASEKVAEFRAAVRGAGRNPAVVPLENIIFFAAFGMPRRTIDAVIDDVATWREAGASAVCIDTMSMGLRGAAEHLGLLRKVAEGVGLGTGAGSNPESTS